MLVSLLFPILLFVLVLVLFRVEQLFVPRDQELRPDGAAEEGTSAGSPMAGGGQPETAVTPRRLGERPLLHHLSLWETLDSAIDEEHEHTPRTPAEPKVLGPHPSGREAARVNRPRRVAARRGRRAERRSAPGRAA